MISCQELYKVFKKNDLTFFAGVPDSTFKDWMKFFNDKNGEGLTNIAASNECEATAIVTGYHLATGKTGVVYMQNSGLGKVVNPVTSLLDKEVYSIPALFMIGWRGEKQKGEPQKPDEPQHRKMGRITLDLLDTLEIPYRILPQDIEGAEQAITEMKNLAEKNQHPSAIIIRKKTLETYVAQKEVQTNHEMLREDAIKNIVNSFDGSEAVVSTTGKTSRELFEYRKELGQNNSKDFLTVGSMGCSSAIALGISLTSKKPVYVLDGDGAAIMQMGSFATIGHYKPTNLQHIIFDNSAYDSTGGQPTVSPTVNFPQIALACGYKSARTVETKQELNLALQELKTTPGPNLVVVKVHKGARKDLGRPTTTPIENKNDFKRFLRE